jgi:hypothetical protein
MISTYLNFQTGVFMPAEPTLYERVNVIVPRAMKRELVRQAKEDKTSLTHIMRNALDMWLNQPKKKRLKI